MQGMEIFQSAIGEAFNRSWLPLIDERPEEINKILANRIYNLDGPRSISRKIEWPEKFIGKLIKGYVEIYDSYQILLDVEVYLRTFPYGGSRVTKARHLRFNIEAYLQENHILKIRLEHYITKTIEDLYKNTDRYDLFRDIKPLLLESIRSTLNDISTARNGHVHESRFIDDQLKQLIDIETIIPDIQTDILKQQYQHIYINNRKRFLSIAISNNKSVKSLLDKYFYILHQLIFDEQGQILYPIRKKTNK